MTQFVALKVRLIATFISLVEPSNEGRRAHVRGLMGFRSKAEEPTFEGSTAECGLTTNERKLTIDERRLTTNRTLKIIPHRF
ncbi:MAG: hypothetical protein ACK5ND_05605 [Bacteroides sp.]